MLTLDKYRTDDLKIFLISSIILLVLCPGVTTAAQRQNSADDYLIQGASYLHEGKINEAISALNKTIEMEPSTFLGYSARGYAYGEKSQIDKAISDYSRAIELNPGYVDVYINRGIAYRKNGQFDKAISDYTSAIELNPRNADAYFNRGIAYKKKGDFDKAISDYTRAIEIDPMYANGYHNRGNAYRESGQLDKAISDYSRAIELNPGNLTAYNNLAWFYATCPDEKYRDGVKAVDLAEKALKIKQCSYILDTLAAAYAEAGRFEDAVTAQKMAIDLLKKEETSKNLIDRYVERLNFWKTNRPWRERL